MSKPFVRLIAFILTCCLGVNPTTAEVFACPSRPATGVTSRQILSQQFSEEAFQLVLLDFTPTRLLRLKESIPFLSRQLGSLRDLRRARQGGVGGSDGPRADSRVPPNPVM